MRFTLLRVGPGLQRFLWSYHHLLLDGRSLSLLLREVLEAYEALRHSRPPAPTASRPYRDYIGWLQRQDSAGAETFWRERLRGFTATTVTGVGRSAPAAGAPAERYAVVPGEGDRAGALQGFDAGASEHCLPEPRRGRGVEEAKKMREAFEVELPINSLFEAQTVEKVAAVIV